MINQKLCAQAVHDRAVQLAASGGPAISVVNVVFCVFCVCRPS